MSEDFLIDELPEVDINNIKIKGKRVIKDVYELLVKASFEGIDLYPYLDDYSTDYQKLYQIYVGIKLGVDVSIYNSPKYSSNAMMCIREALLKGLNPSLFAKQTLNDSQINTLINLMLKGVDVSRFNTPEFKEPEMRFLGERVLEGYDISIYFCEKGHFCIDKMKIIKKLVDINFDFSTINLTAYGNQQLREIYKGVISNVDYNLYSNPDYSYKIMEAIRTSLELKIDVPEYSSEIPEEKYINELKTMKKKVLSSFDYLERDLNTFLGTDYKDKYNEAQIHFLKKAIINGYDLNIFTSQNYSAEQMEEIIFGLEDDLDISKYLDVSLTDIQMNNIRTNLKKVKDEISEVDLFLSAYFKKKKISSRIKNLKKMEENGESLDEKKLVIKKENAYYKCEIFFNGELHEIYNSKECDILEFVEKIKGFIEEMDSLDEEDLVTNIEILENLIK